MSERTEFKTKIYGRKIRTIDEAKDYLDELIKNEEAYHPDEPAEDIIWANERINIMPTYQEDMAVLNENMNNCLHAFHFAKEDIYGYILNRTNNAIS